MGLRFRKSIKIAPGIRLNLSKSGVSTTIGKRGASINVGKKGVYSNLGIPGTGLSMREKIGGSGSESGYSFDGDYGYAEPARGLKFWHFAFIWTIVMVCMGLLMEGFSPVGFAMGMVLSGIPISIICLVAMIICKIRGNLLKHWRTRLFIGLGLCLIGMVAGVAR